MVMTILNSRLREEPQVQTLGLRARQVNQQREADIGGIKTQYEKQCVN